MSGEQTGGALLAEGMYGCVFDTMPKCRGRSRSMRDGRFSDGKRRTRRVVKVMDVKDKTVPIEINIARQLSQIPNAADYFILVDDICIGDDITEDADWSKCGLFRRGSPVPVFVQLRMREGGIRLNDYAMDIDKLLPNWLNIQIHLATALKLLHSRNWVHGDFHFGNILVDDKNVARIIDFGLSYNLLQLEEKNVINMTFLPSYDNYAPELDYAAGMVTRSDRKTIMEQIYISKPLLKEIDDTFPTSSGVLSELNKFADMHQLSGAASIVGFLRKYGTKGDMWTFGFDLYKIYMLMLSVPSFTGSKFYRFHHSAQMRILRGLLQVDPRKRLSADGVLLELYALRMTGA
jgi:serine/threonine protein kinase